MQIEKDWQGGMGRGDETICFQARQTLPSEPSLPGAWLSKQEKCELLHFMPLFSKLLDSEKLPGVGMPGGEGLCYARKGGVPVTPQKLLKENLQHSSG